MFDRGKGSRRICYRALMGYPKHLSWLACSQKLEPRTKIDLLLHSKWISRILTVWLCRFTVVCGIQDRRLEWALERDRECVRDTGQYQAVSYGMDQIIYIMWFWLKNQSLINWLEGFGSPCLSTLNSSNCQWDNRLKQSEFTMEICLFANIFNNENLCAIIVFWTQSPNFNR